MIDLTLILATTDGTHFTLRRTDGVITVDGTVDGPAAIEMVADFLDSIYAEAAA